MISFDTINKLDNIKNFQALQIMLLEVGVSPEIVNNCTAMEAIVSELQKATYGRPDQPVFYGEKSLTVGDSVLKVNSKGEVRVDNYMSQTHKNRVFSEYVPLEITAPKDGNGALMVRGSNINSNGNTSVYYRRVDSEGVVFAQGNEFEWLKQNYSRKTDENGTPIIEYRYASSDMEDVFDPPKPVNYVDNGNPTSLTDSLMPFTSSDAVTLMRRYPNIKGWYQERFGKDFDIVQITSKQGRLDSPTTIDDDVLKLQRVKLLNKVSELLSIVRQQITKLKTIDFEVAFGSSVGKMNNASVEEALKIIDNHNLSKIDQMSTADLEKYIYFLTCQTTKFEHYIINAHSNSVSYKLKKFAANTKRIFTQGGASSSDNPTGGDSNTL